MSDSSRTLVGSPPAAKRVKRSPTPDKLEEDGVTVHALPLRGLADLPVELVYEILILSASPSLPLVSRRLSAIAASAPPSIRARYLISSFQQLQPPASSNPHPPSPTLSPHHAPLTPTRSGTLTSTPPTPPASAPTPHPQTATPRPPPHSKWLLAHALHYPLCTLPVFLALERLWPSLGPDGEQIGDESGASHSSSHSHSHPRPTVDLDSGLWNLPKRLFRSLPACTSSSYPSSPASASASSPPTPEGGSNSSSPHDPYPLLLHLLPRYPFNCSSHSGYPLTMAVRAPHLPLVKLLLERGANPALKEGMAVRVAVARRDLGLVRMLVERVDRASSDGQGSGGSESGSGGSAGVGVEVGGRRKGRKRRRLSDRVEVTAAMLQLAVKLDARDIVQYLMEKGCVPDMKTLRMVR